jgi:CBS domain containing-hemolysin-like protein
MGIPELPIRAGAALYSVPVVGIEISRGALTALGALTILTLIGLSAFFSSSEIAMFSLAKHRIDSMVEEGKPGAAAVKRLKDDPHRLLVTILVGNNLPSRRGCSAST